MFRSLSSFLLIESKGTVSEYGATERKISKKGEIQKEF